MNNIQNRYFTNKKIFGKIGLSIGKRGLIKKQSA
jgi:hypothetical protein